MNEYNVFKLIHSFIILCIKTFIKYKSICLELLLSLPSYNHNNSALGSVSDSGLINKSGKRKSSISLWTVRWSTIKVSRRSHSNKVGANRWWDKPSYQAMPAPSTLVRMQNRTRKDSEVHEAFFQALSKSLWSRRSPITSLYLAYIPVKSARSPGLFIMQL